MARVMSRVTGHVTSHVCGYVTAAVVLSLPLTLPGAFVLTLERTRLNLEAEAWTFDDLPPFATATTGQVAA